MRRRLSSRGQGGVGNQATRVHRVGAGQRDLNVVAIDLLEDGSAQIALAVIFEHSNQGDWTDANDGSAGRHSIAAVQGGVRTLFFTVRGGPAEQGQADEWNPHAFHTRLPFSFFILVFYSVEFWPCGWVRPRGLRRGGARTEASMRAINANNSSSE